MALSARKPRLNPVKAVKLQLRNTWRAIRSNRGVLIELCGFAGIAAAIGMIFVPAGIFVAGAFLWLVAQGVQE